MTDENNNNFIYEEKMIHKNCIYLCLEYEKMILLYLSEFGR